MKKNEKIMSNCFYKITVRSMADVPAYLDAEVSTDGSRGAVSGVCGSQHNTVKSKIVKL